MALHISKKVITQSLKHSKALIVNNKNKLSYTLNLSRASGENDFLYISQCDILILKHRQ